MSGGVGSKECPMLIILADENLQLLVHEKPSPVQNRRSDQVVDGALKSHAF
jgi:hypothetical protein